MMSTVVLLGAGASHGSVHELPVMDGFFDEEAFDRGRYANLDSFVRREFGPEFPLRELNLEEVVTHLYLAAQPFLPLSPEGSSSVILTREELDDYVYRRLVKQLPPPEGPSDLVPTFADPSHSALFRRLRETDSVLSLNYDLIADGTLYELAHKNDLGKPNHSSMLDRSYTLLQGVELFHGRRPTLKRDDLEKGYYLKLHGSVDWFYCPSHECPNHRMFFHNWPSDPAVHVFPGDTCIGCGRRLVRVMVPPALGKTLDDFPVIAAIWSLAYRALCRAETWIVAGVSVADSDYYLRVMLREARSVLSKMELVVINPIEDHRRKLIQLVRPTAVREACSLEEWLRLA